MANRPGTVGARAELRRRRWSPGPGPLVVAALFVLLLGSVPIGLAAPSPHRGDSPAWSRSSGIPEGGHAGTGDRSAARSLTSGEGSILETVDLADNAVLPGNAQPAVQDLPSSAVFDPQNGKVYVRGGLGNSISVINTTREVLTTTVPDWYAQNGYVIVPTMAVDPLTGDLYTTNFQGGNVTVIGAISDQAIRSIYVGGSPGALVFDPANSNFYIANWGGNNVTVLSATTHHTVANIPVGSHPSAILYDPINSRVFVTNFYSSNVSVIDTGTEKVIANPAAGAYPINLGLDTVDNYVDVANSNNGAPSNLTVIDAASDTVHARIGVGADPTWFAYFAPGDLMYVANGASGNVSVVNQSTGVVVAGVSTGLDPYGIVYDAANGAIYVLNSQSENITVLRAADHRIVGGFSTRNGLLYGLTIDTTNGNVFAVSEGAFTTPGPPPHDAGNVTVISPSTGRAIAAIPLIVYPRGIAFDPTRNDLVVVNTGGDDLYLVNASTGRIERTVAVGFSPEEVTFDPATGDLWVVNRGSMNLTVLDSSLHPVASVPTGSSPTAIAYDAADGEIYVTDNLGGNVSVINATTFAVVTSVLIGAFDNLDALLYDPHNHEVYVGDLSGSNVTILQGTTKVGSAHVGLLPVSLASDPRNHTVFVANSGSSNVTVLNDSTNRAVANYPIVDAGFLAYDPSNDAVYNAGGATGLVDATNASTYVALGPALLTGSAQHPTGIAYVSSTQEVGFSTEYAGSVSLIGAAGSSTRYSVTFTESGLVSGTPWSITLNGIGNSSLSGPINFFEPNGSFPYTVGSVPGYTSNLTSGTVVVAGGPRTIDVGFTSTSGGGKLYNVTFLEMGLPQGTLWSVTLEGFAEASRASGIYFAEANGSHLFTVGSVSSFSATPASGAVVVAGGPVTQNVTFSHAPAALTALLVASPASVPVGRLSDLTTTTSGGTPPFTYRYQGLPGGCATQNLSTLPCTPTTAGSYNVSVVVTDAAGKRATANTTLTVAAAPGSSGSSGSTSTLLWLVLILIVVGIILAVLRSRRRRPPDVPSSPPPPPASSPSTSPPSGAPPS
jgi:YVTN family beta-propeller protein